MSGAYLDASAVVKLLVAEAETEELLAFLERWPLRVSSELVRVEVACVCQRQGIPTDDGDELVGGLTLLPLTAATIHRACLPFSPPQRALAALHLAAAEEARAQLACFVTYDSEQAAAATRLSWRVEQPG